MIKPKTLKKSTTLSKSGKNGSSKRAEWEVSKVDKDVQDYLKISEAGHDKVDAKLGIPKVIPKEE